MAGNILVIVTLCVCVHLCFTQNFGFPSLQGNRRSFQSGQYDYSQNYYPNYPQNNGFNNVRPHSRRSGFSYPYNNQNTFNRYYDQYGRPIVRPNEEYIVGGNGDRYYQEEGISDTYQNGRSNGEYVRFPGEGSNGPSVEQITAAQNPYDYNESGSQSVNFPSSEQDQPPSTPVTTVPPPTTLPPLTPAGTEPQPVFTPATETTTLPPLKPVPESEYNNNEPAFGPVETSTLPPLTPVPQTASRTDFNFESSGVFSEPCEFEGAQGSCLPILKCKKFADLLVKARSDPQVVNVLRSAHCGFEGNNPKVCCPAASIPDTPPPSPSPTPSPTTSSTEPIPVEPKAVDTEDSEFVDALPEPPVCGVSKASFTRVVGGVNARRGDFPWMALLGYNKRSVISWSCGGSLITSKHVLTAAHCIHNLEKILYVVRLGEHDLSSDEDGASPVDVLIKKMMKHEGYDRATIQNDIGVLLLEREVQFTDAIKPICIPMTPELRSMTFERYNPLIAGWGALEHRGPSANILQVVQLPVVSNTYCQQRFKDYKQLTIDSRVLCAGYQKGGKDACQGDSGGPLMQPIVKSSGTDNSIFFYQIGVVSFGKKCAEPGFPGVYSRVTTFVPWIEEKVLGPNGKSA